MRKDALLSGTTLAPAGESKEASRPLVAGQQVASVFFDRWGLMGIPTKPMTGRSVLGEALLLVGVVLIRAF